MSPTVAARYGTHALEWDPTLATFLFANIYSLRPLSRRLTAEMQKLKAHFLFYKGVQRDQSM
jgi:hypothetical protein